MVTLYIPFGVSPTSSLCAWNEPSINRGRLEIINNLPLEAIV